MPFAWMLAFIRGKLKWNAASLTSLLELEQEYY
jgi:hypothetical protein